MFIRISFDSTLHSRGQEAERRGREKKSEKNAQTCRYRIHFAFRWIHMKLIVVPQFTIIIQSPEHLRVQIKLQVIELKTKEQNEREGAREWQWCNALQTIRTSRNQFSWSNRKKAELKIASRSGYTLLYSNFKRCE